MTETVCAVEQDATAPFDDYGYFDFSAGAPMDKDHFIEKVRKCCAPDVRQYVKPAFDMLGGIVPESGVYYMHQIPNYVQFVGRLGCLKRLAQKRSKDDGGH